MKFSIITITYNSSATLAETIDSVLTQEGADLEYIIVDGASTDDTVETIKKYADTDDRIKWISEPDEGIADAFNKGLSMAIGDWVGIINSDDSLAPEAIAKVAEMVRRNPEAEVIHGGILRLDEQGVPVFVIDPGNLKSIWHHMPVNHPAMFVSRNTYDQLGGFDKTLRIAMDYDLVLRFYRAGVKFLSINQVLAHMRHGGASDSGLWPGRLEKFQVSVRHGYPRWKAVGWLLLRLGIGWFKRCLRMVGLQRLNLYHPRFRTPD